MKLLFMLLSFFAVQAFAGMSSDPYTGTPIAITSTPGGVTVWEAENYDKGGEGVAFHNPITFGPCTTALCSCVQSAYRPFDGVQMCGVSPLTFVTESGPGLWLNYSINISAVGSYTVELLVAMADANCCAGAAYHLLVDASPVLDDTGKVASIPLGPAQMANWVAFEWRGKSPLFPMVPGQHTLTIVVDKGWFNWDSIRMAYAAGIEWQYKPVWKIYRP